jgi:hypothetical protein
MLLKKLKEIIQQTAAFAISAIGIEPTEHILERRANDGCPQHEREDRGLQHSEGSQAAGEKQIAARCGAEGRLRRISPVCHAKLWLVVAVRVLVRTGVGP